MSALGWYVIHSHPRKEALVGIQVERLGREAFVPRVISRAERGRRDHEVPLFPGYLFARLSSAEGDIPKVRWSHGVRKILGDQEGPRPIADGVVDALRSRSDEHGRIRLGVGLRRGQKVRVVSGPLAGLFGRLVHASTSPQTRVRVLLELFQRTVVVELETAAIRGISSRS